MAGKFDLGWIRRALWCSLSCGYTEAKPRNLSIRTQRLSTKFYHVKEFEKVNLVEILFKLPNEIQYLFKGNINIPTGRKITKENLLVCSGDT